MTTPPIAAGSAPAPKNLVARFIGVFTSPRDTFASVAAFPKWFGMLALTTVIVAMFTALPLTTESGRQAAIDQQVDSMKSLGFPVNDQMYEQMEKRSTSMPYTTGISILVISPIMAVIFAGILFAIFNAAMGGEASFKQVFAVLIHAGPITAISSALSGVVQLLPARAGRQRGESRRAASRCCSENSFAAHLLGMIDLFLVWYFIVLAIGLGGAVPPSHAADCDGRCCSLYAVIAIAIAFVQESGWGSMSRNKKIFIGLGIVVVLGAIVFANFKFKRQDGHRRQRREDPEARSAGDRLGVGQDPAAPPGQHQRRHDGPRDGSQGGGRTGRDEGPVPAADRSAQPDQRRTTRAEASLAAARSHDGTDPGVASTATRRRSSRRRTPTPGSSSSGRAGSTTKETLDNAEQQAQDAPVRAQLGRAQHRDPAPADEAGAGGPREREATT